MARSDRYPFFVDCPEPCAPGWCVCLGYGDPDQPPADPHGIHDVIHDLADYQPTPESSP